MPDVPFTMFGLKQKPVLHAAHDFGELAVDHARQVCLEIKCSLVYVSCCHSCIVPIQNTSMTQNGNYRLKPVQHLSHDVCRYRTFHTTWKQECNMTMSGVQCHSVKVT